MIKKIEKMIFDLHSELEQIGNGKETIESEDSICELCIAMENAITELENILQAYAELD
jgi:hypothetical protein